MSKLISIFFEVDQKFQHLLGHFDIIDVKMGKSFLQTNANESSYKYVSKMSVSRYDEKRV